MNPALKFKPIPRVVRPTYDEFYHEYDLPQRPVVMTGATEDWRAMQLWNHDWFGQTYGSTDVLLSRERTHTTKVASLKLKRYIDLVLHGKDAGLYMDQFSFDKIPGLSDHIGTPYANPGRRNVDLNLWIGPAGTFISLHKDHHIGFDYADNIFAQIRGRKRTVLVSPDQDHLMYARPKEQGAHWHSQVDWENPDFDRFPLFRHVTLLETVVGPGELLFIPGNYWHSLRSLDPSISVSCWWRVHRIADVVVTAIRRRTNPDLAADRITIQDVNDFGGIRAVSEALRTADLTPEIRNLIYSVMEPEVEDALGAMAEPNVDTGDQLGAGRGLKHESHRNLRGFRAGPCVAHLRTGAPCPGARSYRRVFRATRCRRGHPARGIPGLRGAHFGTARRIRFRPSNRDLV